MKNKITIDLSANSTGEIIVLGRYKETSDETSILFVWSGATTTGGVFDIIGYIDETESDSYISLGTVNVNAATGRELRYFDVNVAAIQINYTKATGSVGTANVYALLTETE